MKRADAVPLLAASLMFGASCVPFARAQQVPLGEANRAAAPLLRAMIGTWDVEQRMWVGPKTEPLELEPAVAQRRLIEGAYLEELMRPARPSDPGAFTRTAYLSYNAVRGRYEYFSIDSRAPQQMHYESQKLDTAATDSVKLGGGVFVAAQWGEATNVAFKYRLELGETADDRQILRLYLTPQAAPSGGEFLAFEYVYTRRR